MCIRDRPYVDYAKAHKLVWEADDAYNSPARRETFVTIFSYAMPEEALKAVSYTHLCFCTL